MQPLKAFFLSLAIVTMGPLVASTTESTQPASTSQPTQSTASTTPPPQAKYSLATITQFITMFTGIPQQHLTPKNLILNHLPYAPHTLVPLTPTGSTTGIVMQHIGNCFTPLAKQAPKGYLPITRFAVMTETLLNYLQTILYSSTSITPPNNANKRPRGQHPFLCIGHTLHSVFQILIRKNLIKKLADQKVLVASRTVPKDMRGKDYMMFQSHWAYLLKRSCLTAPMIIGGLLRCASPISPTIKRLSLDFHACSITFFKQIRQLRAAGAATTPPSPLQWLEKALLAIPVLPHMYILKSDYTLLPPEEQKQICDAMFIDINTLEFNFVGHKAIESGFKGPQSLKA